jgi:hypothetical protein
VNIKRILIGLNWKNKHTFTPTGTIPTVKAQNNKIAASNFALFDKITNSIQRRLARIPLVKTKKLVG